MPADLPGSSIPAVPAIICSGIQAESVTVLPGFSTTIIPAFPGIPAPGEPADHAGALGFLAGFS
ncbi:MAG: hypothetical protein Q7T80_01185 [Methanoregula sp.]|nr:hypothetical protein [Methanoregula sp.]